MGVIVRQKKFFRFVVERLRKRASAQNLRMLYAGIISIFCAKNKWQADAWRSAIVQTVQECRLEKMKALSQFVPVRQRPECGSSPAPV